MQYRPYQTQVIDKAMDTIKAHGLVYLMLDTRLGKTIISLSIAHRLGLPCLFITTKKAMPSIAKDHKAMPELIPDYALDIEIVSQDSLHKVSPKRRVIIIDEAHGYGMFPKPSLRAKNLRALTEGNPCILLSATPTPESWSSIFHQLWACHYQGEFISPFRNFYAWASIFVKKDPNTGKVRQKRVNQTVTINDYSDADMEMIKPYLDDLSIRMTQAEAGFNFDKHNEVIISVNLDEPARTIYNIVAVHSIFKDNTITVVADTAAMLMSKLHQLAGGTVIDANEQRRMVSLHKIRVIHELLPKYPKLAIFYKFIGEHDLLVKCFPDVLTEDWQEFQTTDKQIFISQFQSGREGINLSRADAILFYSIDYAYLSYKQGKDRINAKDREQEPVLIWLITADTIEPVIYKKVKSKKRFTLKHFTQFINKKRG